MKANYIAIRRLDCGFLIKGKWHGRNILEPVKEKQGACSTVEEVAEMIKLWLHEEI